MTSLKLALLNLVRRPIPSIIAVVSIAIAVACSGILLRLNRLSEDRFASIGRGGEALVGAKAGGIEILLGALNGEGDYPGYLPMKLFESLKAGQTVSFEDGAKSQPSFIKQIIPLIYFAKADDFRVAGTDETFFHRFDAADTPEFADGHWAAEAGEAVIGSVVAAEKGLRVGDSVAVQAWTGQLHSDVSVSLKVTGVLRPTSTAWDRQIYTSLYTAKQTLGSVDLSQRSIWGADVLNYFLVSLHPGGFESLSSLVNRRTVGQAVLVSEQKARLETLTGTGSKIGVFVTVLILALAGLSVASMLITRFEAMSLQLAVLRAIGYRKSRIGAWLVWEGFLLGLAACVFGALLDFAGFPLMRGLLGDAVPSSGIVSSSLFESVPIWLTAIVATTVSVFIPLYRVYRQDVHFSLRG